LLEVVAVVGLIMVLHLLEVVAAVLVVIALHQEHLVVERLLKPL
jgi:hypothetical protein